MDGARLTRFERTLEAGLGALVLGVVLKSAAILMVFTFAAFALAWVGLAMSTKRRHRKSFTFDRRLLVATTLVTSLWMVFGFALGAGDRSDDPTTLPTLMAIGSSGAALDAQSVLTFGVLSALGIAALLDGLRHVRGRHSRILSSLRAKRSPRFPSATSRRPRHSAEIPASSADSLENT